METVALKSWVIREVTEETVAMEEQVDGEPTGQLLEFERGLLPEDVRAGDEFRVLAQLERAGEDGAEAEDYVHPVFAEATEALSGAGGGD